jgi:hypothetical protein
LDRMGDQLEVHCPPYHFRIIGTRCQSADPWPIEGETCASGDPPTLLALRLRDRLEVETLAEVVTGWGTETLVFLDAIR